MKIFKLWQKKSNKLFIFGGRKMPPPLKNGVMITRPSKKSYRSFFENIV